MEVDRRRFVERAVTEKNRAGKIGRDAGQGSVGKRGDGPKIPASEVSDLRGGGVGRDDNGDRPELGDGAGKGAAAAGGEKSLGETVTVPKRAQDAQRIVREVVGGLTDQGHGAWDQIRRGDGRDPRNDRARRASECGRLRSSTGDM